MSKLTSTEAREKALEFLQELTNADDAKTEKGSLIQLRHALRHVGFSTSGRMCKALEAAIDRVPKC